MNYDIQFKMDKFKYTLVGIALVSGASNTLGYTLQNKQPVVEAGIHKNFFHPYMQVAMRATSHSLSLILYLILRYKNQRLDSELLKEGENEKKDKKIYLRFLIPTLLAYISMICFYIALNFIQGSIYQILRGGTVLTTALFSYTYLKIKPTRQKIAGCIFVLIGLIIVGIVNILMSNDSKDQKAETLIGYALITIGLFANAFSFIYEELLVTKFTVQPLFLIGLEGIYGIIFSLGFIPLLGLIPCDFGNQACVINDEAQLVVQNGAVYFHEIFNNWILLFGVIIVLLNVVIYDSSGVIISKHMNSLTRSICDVTRTVLVWAVGLIITATIGEEDKRYEWQSLSGLKIAGELIGFLIIIFGNLIYYEIIKLKWFNQNGNSIKTQINESSLISISD